MFEQTGTLTQEAAGFLRGENKPVIQFEFSYINIVFILVGLILTLVVSNLIVHAVTKN